jgi:RimJ/RimL family protein N-acetyltransferase
MSESIWRGRLVRLRGVEPGDWGKHVEWDQDSKLSRALAQLYFPRSVEGTRRWAEQAALQRADGDAYQFEIETLAGELVGSLATHDCDPRNGTFSYGVAVQADQQRRGYASEAIALALRYYFQELRYQKVTVRLYAFNEPSLRLHERLGFVSEGRLRRMIYTSGVHHDVCLYGMIAEEFTGALLPRLEGQSLP